MAAPWRRESGLAVPLWRAHVDTDQIIPKQFLKATGRGGYAGALFYDWRREPGFALNQPAFAGASILIAGENFGCGSSREHAAWALRDFGFRAVIAPSFADIFASNAYRNQLVAAAVAPEAAAALAQRAAAGPLRLAVDLEAAAIAVEGDAAAIPFRIPAFHRRCLLEGLDEISLALAHEPAIAAFEARGPVPGGARR